jgi:RimJ/RimL family protein N-acetyltransferase
MPVDYHQSDEGIRAVIRACRPADIPELVEGLASLSTESRTARFLYDKRSFLPDELVQLALPNDQDHWMLMAVIPERDGSERIVGVARCVRVSGTTTADLGIVIRDGFTRSGFGTQLVMGLRDASGRGGITHWRADYFADNRGVEKLLRLAGREEQRENLGGEVVRATIKLGT